MNTREDESTTKYHDNCFRCGDCKTVLRDGYFEVDGKAYCEKDAWRRLQAQYSSRRTPSMSSQRSYGSSSNLAPPGRPGMRGLPYQQRPGPPGRDLGARHAPRQVTAGVGRGRVELQDRQRKVI